MSNHMDWLFNCFQLILWNRTILFYVLVVITLLVAYVAYNRIYMTLRRQKVGGRKTALITGGSSGIGFSLASLYVEDEYNVIIISRSELKLADAKNRLSKSKQCEHARILTWKYDLSEVSNCDEIFQRLQDEQHEVDVLVNNAGSGGMGYFASLPHDENSMITTNCTSLVRLTKLILPGMIQRGEGKILNVASVGGFSPGPFNATYAASKAFVRSFSMALSMELQEHKNVSCTVLSPGATETESFKKAKFESFTKEHGVKIQSAEDCAFEGYRGMMKRELEVISGVSNFINMKILVGCLFPTKFSMKMSYQMLKPVVEKRQREETTKNND